MLTCHGLTNSFLDSGVYCWWTKACTSWDGLNTGYFMDYEPLERILPMTYPSTQIFASASETALWLFLNQTPQKTLSLGFSQPPRNVTRFFCKITKSALRRWTKSTHSEASTVLGGWAPMTCKWFITNGVNKYPKDRVVGIPFQMDPYMGVWS